MNEEADRNAKVEELLPLLKQELGDVQASDTTLRKFLFWKPSVARAAGRYKDNVQWRQDNPVLFDPPLQASKDATLQRVLESQVIIAPDGLVDKNGNTVLIGRLRFNDTSDGRTPEDVVRMAMYTMDRALERESTQQNGIVIFHDLKDVSSNNIHISIPKMLFKAILNHWPLRIAGAYLLNAPVFVRVMFPVISMFMTRKLRSRFHFIDDIEEVYKVIDKDKLLEEHGGKLQHDQKAWVAKHMERETNGTLESLFIDTSAAS